MVCASLVPLLPGLLVEKGSAQGRRHHISWGGHAPPPFSNCTILAVLIPPPSNALTPPHLQIRGSAIGSNPMDHSGRERTVVEPSYVLQTNRLITYRQHSIGKHARHSHTITERWCVY